MKEKSEPGTATPALPVLTRDRPRDNRSRSRERLARIERMYPIGARDYLRVLGALLREFNHEHSTKDKDVSIKTMIDRQTFLVAFFREMRSKTPYAKLDPRQLSNRHIQVMVNRWVERKLSTATIHNYLSFLRTFAAWIGKPGMVREPSFYVGPLSEHAHRTQVAVADKSWSPHGIDIDEKIAEIETYDRMVGLQLRLCREFGVRPKEARHFRPHGAIRSRTEGIERDVSAFPEVVEFVRFAHGTKGGRPRDVPLTTDVQRRLLEACRAAVPPGAFVGNPQKSAVQNRSHFYYVLRRSGISKAGLGVVAHGLRHEAANNAFEAQAQHASPVRGGSIGRDGDVIARTRVALQLGHRRLQVVSAYIGSARRQGEAKSAKDDAIDLEPLP